jgi:RNA polymerase sigma-70 factor (ECF subfamily)
VEPRTPVPSRADPSRVDPASEQALVLRLQAGEAAAFEELLRQEGPRMLAVAERYLRDRHDAEDALQDAFLNVARSIGSFQGHSRLRTWLHRIVANCALMRVRSRARRLPLAPAGADPEREPAGHATGPTRPWEHAAADIASREELRGCVWAALARLEDGDRTLLTLHDIQGMTLDELAQTLNIGRTTVKSHLHRARHALRVELDERLGEAHP